MDLAEKAYQDLLYYTKNLVAAPIILIHNIPAMPKKMIIINGSPKKKGNTAALIVWFAAGAAARGAKVRIVRLAELKNRTGCLACRRCQASKLYECAIKDDLRPLLKDLAKADVIVLATPLFFYGATSQLKQLVDRMFSLYKWDNRSDTFTTPLKGKTLALLGSAYEDVGLAALARPFALTADYTGMKFYSLLVPNAGVSGQITKVKGAREKAMRLGGWLAKNH